MAAREKKPLFFLRAAALIAILLIILGTATAQLGDSPFRRIVFSFHLPLFYLLSGLTLRQRSGGSFPDFARKTALTYVLPYFLWALIYAAFSYKNLGWLLYASYESLERAGSLPFLWFLSCMFAARLLTEAVLEVAGRFGSRRNVFIALAAAAGFAIGFLLPTIGSIGWPWCLKSAFTVTGFLLTGMLLRPVVAFLSKKPYLPAGVFALSLTVFFAGTVLRMESLDMVYLRSGELGHPLWFFLNAFSGSMAVLSFALLLSRPWKSGIPALPQEVAGIDGKTLGTFVIHMPLMQQVLFPLLRLLPFTLPVALQLVLAVLLAKQISGVIISVLDRYVPQLFGKFPEDI